MILVSFGDPCSRFCRSGSQLLKEEKTNKQANKQKQKQNKTKTKTKNQQNKKTKTKKKQKNKNKTIHFSTMYLQI